MREWLRDPWGCAKTVGFACSLSVFDVARIGDLALDGRWDDALKVIEVER